MEIVQFLDILSRRKWVIVSVIFLVIAMVALGTYLLPPVYSASATVRIVANPDLAYSASIGYADRLMNTYVNLLRSRPYLERVIQQLDLRLSPHELSRMVSVEALPDTELIRISVESTSPTVAMEAANMLAQLLIEEGYRLFSGPGKSAREILEEQLNVVQKQLAADRERLQQLDAQDPIPEALARELEARIASNEHLYTMLLNEYDDARLRETLRANSISLVEPAALPVAASKPNVLLNLALASILGILASLVTALIVESLDPRIHSRERLAEAASVPVLSQIPVYGRSRSKQPLLVMAAKPSLTKEAFRLLRSVLLAEVRDSAGPQTFLITSAEPEAGKSTIVANLAVAIAQTGRRVAIVDADLRHPMQHLIFGLSNTVGLVNAILLPETLDAALQNTKVPNLRAISSGPVNERSAELLGSENMRQLLKGLEARADFVLVDSPAIGIAVDAISLAPMVSGILLVVTWAQAITKDVCHTVSLLQEVRGNVMGIILNKTRARSRGSTSL